jgi:hypothetical protein
MGKFEDEGNPESVPLNRQRSESLASQTSTDSGLSIASESFMKNYKGGNTMPIEEADGDRYRDIEDEGENGSDEPLISNGKKAGSSSRLHRIVWLLVLLCVGGWVLAFVLFLTQKRPDIAAVSSASTAEIHEPTVEIHEPDSAPAGKSHGKPVTLEQVLSGTWSPRSHAISWIAGPDGEDGLLVEQGERQDAFCG